MASAILMIDILTMGRETFLPCTSDLINFRAMKNSVFKPAILRPQSYTNLLITLFVLLSLFSSCTFGSVNGPSDTLKPMNKKLIENNVILGNEQIEKYLPLIREKSIAIVGNQTSIIKNTHLIDTLLACGVQIKKVFAPEHGFRGMADNGEHISNETDKKTGLKIISLYGNDSKPTTDQLKDIEVIIYDIQDVGTRFYTYISTLHYIMEACGENDKKLIVLDRPNPNGHYIDGPVLEMEFSSFVGMHPVPIVYGMTVGEYAQMINGESWLKNSVKCDLVVIPCQNYTHNTAYSVPIAPSPNLKTDQAIALYPSLCLFEGTTVSMGRGTDRPFEIYGHPNFESTGFTFTPTPRIGSKNPPFANQKCNGVDCSNSTNFPIFQLDLKPLMQAKKLLQQRDQFINAPSFFNKLAGNSKLKEQIEKNVSEVEIRNSWKEDLENFKKIRVKYLIYKD
ncbi:MAG: hypothetical protein RLZ10_1253 [Bacteroidota bacterium]|jgi:uncharacterized protein YbbC (DUF1343 family)